MSAIETRTAQPAPPPAPPARSRARRWSLALLGVASVGIGALGAVLPGLPTTVFLILASWCFARSCPWLEERLLRNRLFAPYMRWVDRREPMPARAKAAAIGVMGVFVAISVVVIVRTDSAPAWLAAPVLIAACVGAGTIARWKPRSSTA